MEYATGPLQPAVDQFAIAVDELYEVNVRRDPLQSLEALVAGASRGKRPGEIELDYLHVQVSRPFDASVPRVRINIDGGLASADNRVYASAEPFSFVAADHDNAKSAHVCCPGP